MTDTDPTIYWPYLSDDFSISKIIPRIVIMLVYMSTVAVLGGCSIALGLLYFIFQGIWSPLRKLPGPIWTRYMRFWLFYREMSGAVTEDLMELHRQYGMFEALVQRSGAKEFLMNAKSRSRSHTAYRSEWSKHQWSWGISDRPIHSRNQILQGKFHSFQRTITRF